MPENARALPVSDGEAQTLFRALLDYQRSLEYSQIFDSSVVRQEQARVQTLIERISLTSFYPEEDFQPVQEVAG